MTLLTLSYAAGSKNRNPLASSIHHGVSSRSVGPRTVMKPDQEPLFDEIGLVARARQGDTSAFRAIYDQFKNNIAASIHKITRNVHDTEELLQDTFVIAFRKLNHFKGAGSLEGWLRRIAINSAFHMIRKRKRLIILDPDIIALNWEKESLRAAQPDPAKKLEQSEFESDLKDAMGRLDPDLGEVFCLAVLEKRSYADISELLGISLSLVKVRVFRARKQLRAELADHFANITEGKDHDMR